MRGQARRGRAEIERPVTGTSVTAHHDQSWRGVPRVTFAERHRRGFREIGSDDDRAQLRRHFFLPFLLIARSLFVAHAFR